MITREQAKKNLIGFGIEEPSEEQITNYLNQVNGETQKEKDKAEKLKEKADKYDEAQRLLEEEKQKNMTAEEKLAEAERAANEKASEFAKKANRLDAEKILLDAGLTSEDYEAFIDGIVSEDNEQTKALATSLAGTFKAKNEAALQKAKQELLDAGGAGDEGNHTGGAGGDEKTEDVKFAEDIAKTFSSNSEISKSVFENY